MQEPAEQQTHVHRAALMNNLACSERTSINDAPNCLLIHAGDVFAFELTIDVCSCRKRGAAIFASDAS